MVDKDPSWVIDNSKASKYGHGLFKMIQAGERKLFKMIQAMQGRRSKSKGSKVKGRMRVKEKKSRG